MGSGMISRRALLQGAAGAAGGWLTVPQIAAAATPAYPAQPARWIVPYTAGGATDVLSRLICQHLSDRLGQPFVVENKPGAGSNIGTQAVINAPPDGYTLLLTSTANAINASFDPTLPYDFAKGIMPVAGVARIPLVLVVNNELPIHNVAEFIAYAKANPGKINFASAGIGTGLHVSGELFKMMAGIQMTHVPYRSDAPAIADLIAGQVQVMFDPIVACIEQVKSGTLRALGVTTAERSPALPDVPPIADTVPGYEARGWQGVGAPRGTPAEIVNLLNTTINASLADPKMVERLAAIGNEPLVLSPQGFAELLAEETEKWGRVVKFANIKVD